MARKSHHCHSDVQVRVERVEGGWGWQSHVASVRDSCESIGLGLSSEPHKPPSDLEPGQAGSRSNFFIRVRLPDSMGGEHHLGLFAGDILPSRSEVREDVAQGQASVPGPGVAETGSQVH